MLAKGIKVPEGTCHLAITFLPLCGIYGTNTICIFSNGAATGSMQRYAMRLIRPWLQKWDSSSNSQIHNIIAISQYVAQKDQGKLESGRPWWSIPLSIGRYLKHLYTDEGFYLMVSSLVSL